ncbi:MAG: nitroreductase family protein [Pseudomonadales bacterium]|nr:nitroreductase family protein [Pseudomonadales bacterium]
MFSKEIDTFVPINALLSERWSGVAYDPERQVSADDIRRLAEAARWAPSCFGDQPWRYIIVNRFKNPEAWQKGFDCLAEGNKAWVQHAPLLILACHDTCFSHNGMPNNWGSYDTGAASMSLCIQATALGLMTHQMAGFMPDKARTNFAIPERYTPLAMITVGYQLPADKIPEQFRPRETSPRKRNPLAAHFFENSWGDGLL